MGFDQGANPIQDENTYVGPLGIRGPGATAPIAPLPPPLRARPAKHPSSVVKSVGISTTPVDFRREGVCGVQVMLIHKFT